MRSSFWLRSPRGRAPPLPSFDAQFSNSVDADDPAARIFKAVAEDAMREKIKQWKPYFMLLMIRYCKRFVANGKKLPPAPSNTAATRAFEEAAASPPFKHFFNDNYTGTEHSDWHTLKERTVTRMADLLKHYKEVTGNTALPADVKKMMAEMGHPWIAQVQAPAGALCPERKKLTNVFYVTMK